MSPSAIGKQWLAASKIRKLLGKPLTHVTGCVCRVAWAAARVHRAAGVRDGAFWQLRGGGLFYTMYQILVHKAQHTVLHSGKS